MPDELDCIFCQIVGGQAPATFLYEDEKVVVFMDVNPATDGHCLVVSREHAPTIFELPEGTLESVAGVSKKVAHALREALTPDGLNLIQANGPAAFQTVDHFHVHLVPRWAGDPIKLPWIPSPGDPDRIAEVAQKVRDQLPD